MWDNWGVLLLRAVFGEQKKKNPIPLLMEMQLDHHKPLQIHVKEVNLKFYPVCLSFINIKIRSLYYSP